ncbi:hypothetical protein [Acinetobacter phage HFM1]|nr:hypothetical protein [Acinetobacter phage HFM1]
MKIFNNRDLVHGEYYFCVYQNQVWYLYASNIESISDDFFSMCNDDHRIEFDAYECSLIYQL